MQDQRLDGKKCDYLYLDKVAHGGCISSRLCIHVFYTGELKHSLASRSSNDASSSGSRNELDKDRGALAIDLAGDSVGFSELGAPVSPPDRDDGELCEDDGASNGGGYFFRTLDPQS